MVFMWVFGKGKNDYTWGDLVAPPLATKGLVNDVFSVYLGDIS